MTTELPTGFSPEVSHKLTSGSSFRDNQLADHVREKAIVREKQLPAVHAIEEFLNKGETRGFVKMPTGTGKTVIFTQLVDLASKHEMKTLILTSRSLLVDQVDAAIGQHTDLTHGRGKITGDLRRRARNEAREQRLITMTYNRFLSMVQRNELDPGSYDLVILDEGHHALGPQTESAIALCAQATLLGFTATPVYTETKSLLSRGYTEIYSMDIADAVRDGLLCPCSALLAHGKADLTKVNMNKRGEYIEKELAKAVNIETRNQAAIRLSEQPLFTGKKTIVYCVGIDHAEKVAQEYQIAGFRVSAISSRMSRKLRDSILAQYRSGTIQVLCNADLLIEGFDDPATEICISLRPTMSSVLAEQRAGRVLRLDPANPEKHAYVIDFVDDQESRLDSKHTPVTFAEIAEGALILHGTGVVPPHRASDDLVVRNVKKNLEQISIPELQVTVDYEEVMRLVHNLEQKKYLQAQSGEFTLNGLADRLSLPVSKVEFVIGMLRIVSIGLRLDPRGNPRPHFPSGTEERISDYIKNEPKAPQGWLSASQIAQKLGYKKQETVLIIMRKFRKNNPDMAGEFPIGRGGKALFCHPKVLESFHLDRTELQPKPTDYYTMNEMLTGIAIAGYRPKNKSFKRWLQGQSDIENLSGTFLLSNNTVEKCYHVSLIIRYKEVGEVSEGWIRIKEAAERANMNNGTLLERIRIIASEEGLNIDDTLRNHPTPNGQTRWIVNEQFLNDHMAKLIDTSRFGRWPKGS